MTTMTITRALSMIKSLKEQISIELNNNNAVIMPVVGEDMRNNKHMKASELTAMLQSNFDSLRSKTTNLYKLRNAVNEANSRTYITFLGKQITVVEAITYKSMLHYKESVLDNFKKQIAATEKEVSQLETVFEKRVDDLIKASVTESMTVQEKANLQETMRQQQLRIAGPKVHDPVRIREYVKALEEEILHAKNELDYILSTVNTQTMIEVDLG